MADPNLQSGIVDTASLSKKLLQSGQTFCKIQPAHIRAFFFEKKGVRQRDPCSGIRFDMYIDGIVEAVSRGRFPECNWEESRYFV